MFSFKSFPKMKHAADDVLGIDPGGGGLAGSVENAGQQAINSVEDIPGSVQGFVNNPLQSIEKGLGQTVNTAFLGQLTKNGIQATTIGGGIIMAAAGQGIYALINPATGATAYTSAAPVVGPSGSTTLGAPVYDASGHLLAAAGQPFTSATLANAGGSAAVQSAVASGTLSSFLKQNAGSLIGAGVMAGAGIYEGSQAADQAKTDSQLQYQLGEDALNQQTAQNDKANALAQQEIDLSKDQYQHSLDVGKSLEANADLSPDYINSQTARAGLTATQQYQSSLDAEKRGLMRMGVDPSSGRYVDSTRIAGLDATAAKVGAMNNTRTGLTDYAKSLKAQALSAELGISNPAIAATGNAASTAASTGAAQAATGLGLASTFGQNAQVENTNAMNAYNSGLTAAGTILGRGLNPPQVTYPQFS